MSWTPHRSIVDSVITLRAASRSVGGSFKVLGTVLSDVVLREMIRDALGIGDDMVEPEAVEAHIGRTMGAAVALPDQLAQALTDASIARDDVDLARHMGVDPLRLLTAGHAATATAVNGKERVRSIPLWQDGRLDRVDVAFTLGKGVTWRRGTLRSTNTQIPHTLLDSMEGRTLDGIVDHGWEGWKRLRVKRASQSGRTLVIQTGDQAETTLSGL